MNEFQKNLIDLIASTGLSQTEIAKRVGVPQPTLNRMIISDHFNPTLRNLTPLSDYFGVTIDALVGRTPLPGQSGAGSVTLPSPRSLAATRLIRLIVDLDRAGRLSDQQAQALEQFLNQMQ